jgi:hypothetical protein
MKLAATIVRIAPIGSTAPERTPSRKAFLFRRFDFVTKK